MQQLFLTSKSKISLGGAKRSLQFLVIMAAAVRILPIFLVFLLLQCCRSEQNCTIWHAKSYRDCICGIQYRDWEEQCHDEYTYFETTLHQDLLSDGFECCNGGIKQYLPEFRYYTCNCMPGYYGFCCELRKKRPQNCSTYTI